MIDEYNVIGNTNGLLNKNRDSVLSSLEYLFKNIDMVSDISLSMMDLLLSSGLKHNAKAEDLELILNLLGEIKLDLNGESNEFRFYNLFERVWIYFDLDILKLILLHSQKLDLNALDERKNTVIHSIVEYMVGYNKDDSIVRSSSIQKLWKAY